VSAAERSIFARIIAGEIPCQRVFENAQVFAFLDIHPLADGHTLVMPKRAVARLEDLTAAEAAETVTSNNAGIRHGRTCIPITSALRNGA